MADFIVDDEQMSSEPSGSDNDEDYARTSKLVALQKGDDAAPTARCVLSMGMCVRESAYPSHKCTCVIAQNQAQARWSSC